MPSPRSLLCLLVLAALLASPLGAFDFIVTRYDDPAPDGCLVGDCSLREAVIAANVALDADRILLSAGTYRLSIPGTGENLAADGDLDVLRDLEILGVDAGLTRLDSAGTGETTLVASQTGLDFTMRRVSIKNSDDAGLRLGVGSHVVEDCESRDNGNVVFGSGIETSVGSQVQLRRITVAGNSGFGLRITQGSASVENSTISGNDSGGLFVNLATTVVVSHCTIGAAGGANVEVQLSNSAVQLANSIVVGTCSLGSGSSIDSLGGNVESTGNTCQLDHGSDSINVSTGVLALGALAANGGEERTHLPAASSAAAGAANDALCLTADQRGVARATDCESGSVELTAARVPTAVFIDGFLQGNTAAWSAAIP